MKNQAANLTTSTQDAVIDLGKFPASVLNEQVKDRAAGIAGAPPNFSEGVIPHIWTMQGHVSSHAKVYQSADEALKHSRENARYMRNECGIMECLEARQRGTALLKWHLSPEDEKDAAQRNVCNELTQIIKRIPNFLEYRRNLLEALWYGRAAVSQMYSNVKINGSWRKAITRWEPRHGDKLVFRYDDGSRRFEPGQVGLLVSSAANKHIPDKEVFGQSRPKIEVTHDGLAYFFDKHQRPLLAVHKHIIEDGDYRDPYGADSINGVGIRSRIYWSWFQMQECMAWLMEYLERSAFGIEIWNYPFGNAEAEIATRKAAEERIGGGRSIVLVPVPKGENADLYGTKRIEPGMDGVSELKEIIGGHFGHKIKRYILGQTLTSEVGSTGMGSAVAEAHIATYQDIIRYDAQKLQETLTNELVRPLLWMNFPNQRDLNIRFVIDTEAAHVDSKLAGLKAAYDMGLKLKGEDIYGLIGATMPEASDVTVGNDQ